MPVEVKPLFRPDVLQPRVKSFQLPASAASSRGLIYKWAELLELKTADRFKEQELLPDYLTDIFTSVLGYARPTDNSDRYTISREQYVEVDGKFADAAIGVFGANKSRFVIAVEGKGPTDPLDRPFKNRKMSAVDQGYRYAINLPCDWIIVTSMRQIRLYCKGNDQHTFERFLISDLAVNDFAFKRFVFLLGADRVVPQHGGCHLDQLRAASEKAGRELTKDFYLRYANMREDAFEQLCAKNPEHSRHALLTATQKLLDRVLFCAFCEDRGLLPDDTLTKAFEHHDPYNPKPVWENFRGLFRSIDIGNEALKIPQYNGGLFAEDDVLDRLTIPDTVCRHFNDIGEYDYRSMHETAEDSDESVDGRLIDVDILGHIFEQSITDLEQLRNELDGLVPPQGKEKHKTRRKKEGAFYTPAFITRYIIEQTLGFVLADRFEALRESHQCDATGTAVKSLDDPRVYDLDALNTPQREALTQFWEAWQDELATVRVLDPACGSGAFLIEAYDQLHATYQASNDRLKEIRGHRTLFDLDRQILQNNLYGVDLNDEAIQICRLSLWIKTAQRGKMLTSLDHTIRVGNSVVNDPEVHPLAFDWSTAFPEVTESGGFDVVVGNPPYIRQEWIASFKTHWEENFRSFTSTADIFVYFYELGFRLLRNRGRLGFITSGSWVFSNFGRGLRKFLADESCMSSLIDFGEFQPFKGAEMIRPTIAIVSKNAATGQMRLFKWLSTGHPPENLSDEIAVAAKMTTDHLSELAWELEPDNVRQLKTKMLAVGQSMTQYTDGMIIRGVVTGRNEAFLIDNATRTRLIDEDSRSEEIIHRYVMGTDVHGWHVVERDRYIIFTRQGIKINDFPAVFNHLLEFRDILEPKATSSDKGPGRKPGRYKWYEIQDASDFFVHFKSPKLVWPDIAKLPRFVLDTEGSYLDATCFMIPGDDFYLLGILNSWASWFLISKMCQPLRLRGDRWQYRLKKQWLINLPIPDANQCDRDAIAGLACRANSLGKDVFSLKESVRHRLMITFGENPDGSIVGKLNNKAHDWCELTMTQLGAALKASFKLSRNPFQSPVAADEWERYLAEKKVDVDRITRQLHDIETELNDRVFRLFNLTHDEIALLTREVEH